MKRGASLRHAWRGRQQEFRPLLQLAGPVVLAEVGWMSMGLVDTIMVGRVSPEALGAVGVGGTVCFTVALFGIGLLLGLDYTVAHAIGAGQTHEAHRWLAQALYVAFIAAVPGMAIVWWGMPLLALVGIRTEVLDQAILYGRALSWSLFPLFVLTAVRRYLQAFGLVRAVSFAVISANVINAVGNWMLVFGHLGFRAMGAEGSGWATCISRIYMALSLIGYLLIYEYRNATGLRQIPLRPDGARIRRLIALGLPAATQMALECGVFATATALAGRLEPVALAAHQIALNAASFTFMVPLGISSAAAVRVGQAMGRRDIAGAGQSGWTALALGAAFMVCAGAGFVAFPAAIIRLFSPDRSVIATGAALLLVAAVFQLFDGVQVVATGVLRGSGDTRTPMLSNLVGHWVLGLPIGYALCFHWGWGVVGLWVGLCIGLVAVAITLLWVWGLRVRLLAAGFHTREQGGNKAERAA